VEGVEVALEHAVAGGGVGAGDSGGEEFEFFEGDPVVFAQVEDDVSSAFLSRGGFQFLEAVVDVVFPTDFHLVVADEGDLLAQAIEKTLGGVEDERHQVAARLARSIELSVVIAPGLVVVIAGK